MEKLKKSLYLKKLTCLKKGNLKFVEMFLAMMVWFINQINNYEKPSHEPFILIESESSDGEERQFLAEVEMKMQILKEIWKGFYK